MDDKVFIYIFLSVFQILCVMKRQLLRETREKEEFVANRLK